MENIMYIIFFLFGTIFGSFFHVVATRMSKEESIISPPSHCHLCNHKLRWYELIPVISFIIQKGKCRNCKTKLPPSYLIVELVTGILFCVCYHVFGISIELVIGLIFISSLIIVIISDIEYMIILDEVLMFSSLIIIIISIIGYGFETTAFSIYSGIGAFLTMYVVKILGDKAFKRESLGGGDIKLMFFFGIVLGYALSVCTIFLATFIAFPIALVILFLKKDHIIPFGPFLSISAIILFISQITFTDIIYYLIGL